ncbi:hypothetical protein V8D89_012153 [Ganoderma adspersum]
MPASSGRSSMSVVRRYTSASDRTRGYCGGTRDDKADAFNGAQRVVNAPLASGDVLDGPSTPVAQYRRCSAKTDPNVSISSTLRRSFLAANFPEALLARSKVLTKGFGFQMSNEIPEDARRSILGGIEGIQVTYRDSPVSEYYSIASDRIEELDTRLAFSLPEESPIKDSATCTPLELSTTLPSMSDFQEESSCAAEQKDLSSVDPAYRALLPIVYGLEEIIFNPRRRSLGEEHGDEDYTKFWETFGQLSAKEVLHAVYVIRSGALKPCIESPSQHSDLSFLTTFCALWAGLATIVAFYFYFYSL